MLEGLVPAEGRGGERAMPLPQLLVVCLHCVGPWLVDAPP